jgi:hypothetical protein
VNETKTKDRQFVKFEKKNLHQKLGSTSMYFLLIFERKKQKEMLKNPLKLNVIQAFSVI